MNLTKEQFIQLVIALEHRNLTLGLVRSVDLDEGDGEEAVEIPEEIASEIESFEDLQHSVYASAERYGLADQFTLDEDTGQLIVAPDTELEQEVWTSIEEMEQTVAYERIVREKAIEYSHTLREGSSPESFEPEIFFPKIEAFSRKYWSYLKEKGLLGLIRDL
ncbi:hypothetical protein [Kiloniella sp. b19]|uniref:hypothetical protein n=1 Tax=Kiloniella sp. GXU_MW_B19 TaxID=3141326 RepID=UPI0031CDB04F